MASVKDMTRFGIDLSAARKISCNDFEILARQGCKPEIGDVLIAKDGNSALDTTCCVDKSLDAVLLSSVAILRPNPKILDSHFLKHYLSSPDVIAYMKSNFISGAAIPRVVLRDFKKAEIKLPPLEIQRSIAEALDCLDDRIDLLRQTNTTLEAIAQALFKSWFIDFDPVRAKAEGREPEGMDAATAALFPSEFEESALGLIPKGWRYGCLGNVLIQRISRAKRSDVTEALPYVPIECITAKSVFLRDSLPGEQAQSSLTLFRQGDILFGAMRPYFHKVCIAPFDGVTRTTAFVLEPKAGHGAFGLFAAFDDSTIEFATTHSEGSTIPYAKWSGSLERKPLVLPPNELVEVFESIVAPLLTVGIQNARRMQMLAELRDTLLPRLISGKLRLPEAREQLEDALA